MKLVSVKLFFVIAILLFKTSFIFSQENEIAMPYLKGDMYGYGNSKGEIVIEPKYDYVLLFENGYAMVRLDNKWGLIKQNGQVLFEPIAKQISPFDSNGLAEVIVENKSGVINTKGDWVVPREYTMVDIKFNFIAVTNSQNQAALLDLSGKKNC
ncbi:MAG: WG repeat-containing protein [Crocinitomicaceae bacterium]|nr:WG repeat-containing protein [Crocinitomicaceae bacterium]